MVKNLALHEIVRVGSSGQIEGHLGGRLNIGNDSLVIEALSKGVHVSVFLGHIW